MTRRKWIKIHVDDTLRGKTFKELSLEERAIWFELLLLAGDSPFQEDGMIAVTENVGYTKEQLSALLDADIETTERTLQKLIDVEKIKVDEKGRIFILNWNKYQSPYVKDYMRVKRWRQKQKKNDTVNDTVKDTVNDTQNDTDYDKLTLEQKREKILALVDDVLKELKNSYPISFRVIAKTRIKLANVLFSLVEIEKDFEKAKELFLKAWKVYYETGKRGSGFWSEAIKSKNFSLAYFLGVIQYFIDAAVSGLEVLSDKKQSVKQVSHNFEDFNIDDMPF